MIAIVVAVFFGSAQAQGRFKGKLVAELLKDGRNIELVQAFGYIDSKGQHWDVPAGSKTDGASVPRIFWQLRATEEEQKRFMSDLQKWVDAANPSREEIAKAIDLGRVPKL